MRALRASSIVVALACAGAVGPAPTHAFGAIAQASAIDRDAQRVIERIANARPPFPATTHAALEPEERALLDEARAHVERGDTDLAWSSLSALRSLSGREHPEPLRIGAEAAHIEKNALREAFIRRRLLTLAPDDEANRAALARLIGAGAPASDTDAWVLASTLRDETELDETGRVALLRALARRLRDAGEDEDALAIARTLPDEAIEAASPRGEADAPAPPTTLASTLAAIEASPLDAHALVDRLLRAGADAEGLSERASELAPSPASAALRAHLLCAIGRASYADGVLRNQLSETPGAPAALGARARTLGLLGDYASLREIGASLGTESAQELELGALLLFAGAGHDGARERIDDALARTDPGDATSLVRRATLASAIALASGDTERASRVLIGAHRAAPSDVRPLRALIELHASEGAAPNAETHTMASSRLLATVGATHEADVLRASAALRRGYSDIAEGVLEGLASSRPEDPLPARELVRLWLDTDRLDRAEAWLRARLEARPALSHLRTLLADVLVARGETVDAEGVLEEWYDDHPGEMLVALRLESFYRDDMGAADAAERIALRRLRRMPDSIDRLKERVRIVSRSGEPAEIERELDLLLPLAADAGHDLGAWSEDVFARLHQQTVRANTARDDVSVAVARLHAEVRTTTLRADVLALRALAARHPAPRAVIDAVRRAMARHPDQAGELAIESAETLLANASIVASIRSSDEAAPTDRLALLSGRARSALEIARRAVDHELASGEATFADGASTQRAENVGRALMLIRQAAARDVEVGEHARAMVDALLAMDNPFDVLTVLHAPASADNPRLRDRVSDADRAEAAHVLSYPLDVTDDHARSDALSELALRIDPANATINNDFGYRLAERGVRLDEAEAMTRRAVATDPTNHSFVDSLAWVLYKRGRLEDRGPEAGAVTLLERSYGLASDNRDVQSAPVIADHWGDALWASGREEEAVEAWERALPLAREIVTRRRVDLDTDPADAEGLLRRHLLLVRSIEAKLEAARKGEAPAIAPRAADAERAPGDG